MKVSAKNRANQNSGAVRPAINYFALIVKYTWWRSSDKRVFVVVDRGAEPAESGQWKINWVALLEILSDDVVIRPWDEMVRLVDTGSLKPVPDVVKQKYLDQKILI